MVSITLVLRLTSWITRSMRFVHRNDGPAIRKNVISPLYPQEGIPELWGRLPHTLPVASQDTARRLSETIDSRACLL